MSAIPVIDLGGGSRLDGDQNSSNDWTRRIGTEIRNAFQSVGFCYIKNHDIDKELLSDFLSASRAFFEQPSSKKAEFSRQDGRHFGWEMVEREALNPARPGDLKEAFNYLPAEDPGSWSGNMENFTQLHQKLFTAFTGLALQILDALSEVMDLPDRSFLSACHTSIGTTDNTTALRNLYYPPLDPSSSIKPGQIRCGEHTDYGTITLLYQDNAGGLEVESTEGEFIAATPIPGTILVNIGSIMQRWSADVLHATKHRVVVPEAELLKAQCRQSIAFFVNPDNELVIKCLDGSDKYEPISYIDYLNYRLDLARKY